MLCWKEEEFQLSRGGKERLGKNRKAAYLKERERERGKNVQKHRVEADVEW